MTSSYELRSLLGATMIDADAKRRYAARGMAILRLRLFLCVGLLRPSASHSAYSPINASVVSEMLKPPIAENGEREERSAQFADHHEHEWSERPKEEERALGRRRGGRRANRDDAENERAEAAQQPLARNRRHRGQEPPARPLRSADDRGLNGSALP